ncbi:zinc finger protein 45-like [Argonauta hians]
MEQYSDNKDYCSKICGQDCPQRQLPKFSNNTEKPAFPLDIYGRHTLPITSLPYSVDNTAFYTNMYLKEFAQRSSLHLPHLVEKAFHSNLYSKELAQRHSYLSQRMPSGIEKSGQNNDIYSKDLSLRSAKSQHHKSRSSTSSKMAQCDTYPKDYSQRIITSQAPKSKDNTHRIYQNSSYKDMTNSIEQQRSSTSENCKGSSQMNYSRETIQRYTYPILKQISHHKSSHRRQNREVSQSMKASKLYSQAENPVSSRHYNKDLMEDPVKDTSLLNNCNRYDSKDSSITNHHYSAKPQINQAHQANDKNVYQKDYGNPPISVHNSYVQDNSFPSWYHFMPNKHTQTYQSSFYNKPMADNSDYQNIPLDVSKKSMLNSVSSNEVVPEVTYHTTPAVSSNFNAGIKDKELNLANNKRDNHSVEYPEVIPNPVLIDLDKKSQENHKISVQKEFLPESLDAPMQLPLENNSINNDKPPLSNPDNYDDCLLSSASFLEPPDLPEDFKKDLQFQTAINDNYSSQVSNDSKFQSSCNGSSVKSFQCKVCLKLFAQRYYLQIHNRIHTGEKPFHCDLCPKQFVRKDSLQIHRRSHTGERPFQCDICLKHFAQKHYLLIHEKTHSNEKPFQCDICFKHFAQRHYLQVHQKTHTGQKQYECDICKEQFTHKDYLQIHRRSHTGEKPFQCDICIQRFSRKDTLVIHRRIHTGEKPFECNFCHKMFSQRSKLHIHKRTHIRKKSHQCNVCQKQFAQRYYLHIHMQSHSDEKRFKCSYCQKPFAQKYYLHIHQRVHTGEKPFNCDVCLKRFARRDTLQVHKRTHTGEKPFQCEICNQLFAQKDKLQIHKRTHSGEKPFRCDYCNKQFSQRNTLQLHLRIHTGEKPFKCEICHKNFAQRNYLVIHRRTHTGEKPFRCEKCGQKFARHDTLQIHLRTHMEIHPVPCNICGRKFINMEKLQIHKDSVHESGSSDNGNNENESNSEQREKELTMLCDVSPKTEQYVLQQGADVTAGAASTEQDADGQQNKADKPIHEFPSVTNYLWHTI